MRNALSVDVEDWFQVGAFETVIARDAWETLPRRVERNTDARPRRCSTRPGSRRPSSPWAGSPRAIPALIRRIAEAGPRDRQPRLGPSTASSPSTRPSSAPTSSRARDAIEDAGGTSRRPAIARRASRSTRARPGRTGAGRAGLCLFVERRADRATTIMAGANSPRFAWRPVAGADLIELPVTTRRRRRAAARGRRRRLLPVAALCASRAGRSRRVNRAERPAGDLLFPSLGDRSRPAARRRTRRSNRGCAITPISRAMRPKLLKLLQRSSNGAAPTEVAAAEQARLA